MRARTGPRAPPYPAPPLRHFPSVQTAFGDLENDLRSGAGAEAPRALTAKARLPFTTSPMTDGDLGDGETRVRQVKAKQLSTGGGGRKGPLHESAGLVWQAWRPGDRLGTITKAKATGTQAEKGKAPRTGGGCGNRPPVITGSYEWTMSRGR